MGIESSIQAGLVVGFGQGFAAGGGEGVRRRQRRQLGELIIVGAALFIGAVPRTEWLGDQVELVLASGKKKNKYVFDKPEPTR